MREIKIENVILRYQGSDSPNWERNSELVQERPLPDAWTLSLNFSRTYLLPTHIYVHNILVGIYIGADGHINIWGGNKRFNFDDPDPQ